MITLILSKYIFRKHYVNFFLAGLAVSCIVNRANAQSSANREVNLYDCYASDNVDVRICESPYLKKYLESLTSLYKKQQKTTDFDLTEIYEDDKFYFRLQLADCNQELFNVGGDAAVMTCLEKLIKNKLTFIESSPDKDMLIKQILESGFLDGDMLEKYPAEILGHQGKICGTVDFPEGPGKDLVGTFLDCRNRKSYRVLIENPLVAALNFYRARPSVTSWFSGHFQRAGDEFVLIIDPNLS